VRALPLLVVLVVELNPEFLMIFYQTMMTFLFSLLGLFLLQKPQPMAIFLELELLFPFLAFLLLEEEVV
jgi:hypothetical protein